jgi:hypothetical protein
VEFCPARFRHDPRDLPGWSTDRWAKGPLGITGLRSVSLSLTEPAEVVAGRLAQLLGAEVVDAGRAGRRDFTEVRIAGDAYRLLSPPASGTAGEPTRGGVASIDFAVADLADVHRWARAVGVPVVTVDEGRLALPGQLNLGTRVEFVQD